MLNILIANKSWSAIGWMKAFVLIELIHLAVVLFLESCVQMGFFNRPIDARSSYYSERGIYLDYMLGAIINPLLENIFLCLPAKYFIKLEWPNWIIYIIASAPLAITHWYTVSWMSFFASWPFFGISLYYFKKVSLSENSFSRGFVFSYLIHAANNTIFLSFRE